MSSTSRVLVTEIYMFFFFFFQAEDGIRDYKVTGVQTCALPISRGGGGAAPRGRARRPRARAPVRHGGGRGGARRGRGPRGRGCAALPRLRELRPVPELRRARRPFPRARGGAEIGRAHV